MKKISLICVFFLASGLLIQCSKDDDTPDFIGRSKEYTLHPVNGSGVTGSIIITERKDGHSSVLVSINNAAKDVHPAFIYYNDEAKGGEVAFTLKAIDCSCASSTTEVSKMDNGVPIRFDDLIGFNGHIRVHKNKNAMDQVLAMGNIGSNVK